MITLRLVRHLSLADSKDDILLESCGIINMLAIEIGKLPKNTDYLL